MALVSVTVADLEVQTQLKAPTVRKALRSLRPLDADGRRQAKLSVSSPQRSENTLRPGASWAAQPA